MKLQSLHQEILNLDSQLKSSCTSARYQKFNDEISRSVNNLESVLISRRNEKIGGLLAKQQRRHRRFRRPRPEATLPPVPNTVINLSSCIISDAEHKLLSKGLNFCPTPREVNQAQLSQDLTEYYRRIRLREFFLDAETCDPEPFRIKSTWIPPKNRIPALETYVQVVSSQVTNPDNFVHRSYDNLPREERLALNTLRLRTDIIIKPADKGSAVVVMDRQQYIDEAHRQLNNSTNYTCLD